MRRHFLIETQIKFSISRTRISVYDRTKVIKNTFAEQIQHLDFFLLILFIINAKNKTNYFHGIFKLSTSPFQTDYRKISSKFPFCDVQNLLVHCERFSPVNRLDGYYFVFRLVCQPQQLSPCYFLISFLIECVCTIMQNEDNRPHCQKIHTDLIISRLLFVSTCFSNYLKSDKICSDQ